MGADGVHLLAKRANHTATSSTIISAGEVKTGTEGSSAGLPQYRGYDLASEEGERGSQQCSVGPAACKSIQSGASVLSARSSPDKPPVHPEHPKSVRHTAGLSPHPHGN